MNFFKYLLVISITVLLTLGCVYGFSCISCDEDSETAAEAVETMSVTVLADDSAAEDIPDEDETVEVKQWVRITFDVVVIALSVGIIVLVWWFIKRVTKKSGNSNRRFG